MPRLSELFPKSSHVFDAGFVHRTPDIVIWEYAKLHGFTIVTTDADFMNLAEERGTPPKIVRVENCNYRTARVEELLRRNAVRITALESSSRAILSIRNE